MIAPVDGILSFNFGIFYIGLCRSRGGFFHYYSGNKTGIRYILLSVNLSPPDVILVKKLAI